MLTGIDHVIIATADPEAAAGDLATRLQLHVSAGGRHEDHGTFNRLVWLGDSYVELMGVFDRRLAAESWWGRQISALLESTGAAYAGTAFATDDLAGDVDRLRAQGSPISDPTAGQRTRADGEVVRWKTSRVPAPDSELGLLFVIEHDTAAAEWRPHERGARAAQSHPLGTPARLARVELPVSDMRAATMRLHRDLGLAFRPSLAGGGARDTSIGPQTLRLTRSAVGLAPLLVLRGGHQRRSAGALGLDWQIEPG